jgi:hypothetical protein
MKFVWKMVETIAEIKKAIARRHLNRHIGS